MRGKLPPPVEGGTGTYGSRGRLIDRLMGDRRNRELARRDIDHLISRSRRGVAEDPPPARLPSPVPAGPKAAPRTRLRFRNVKPRPAR